MTLESNRKNKLRSDDRVFKLCALDDKHPISTSGLIDKRLFTGDNKLHAIKNGQTTLWSLKYDQGGVPEYLRQQFTSFKLLVKVVGEYFAKRNIKIEEIID